MALHFEAKAEPGRTPIQTIDLICELAKTKNKGALSNLISSGVCIDISSGTETAAQRIASEERVDIDALELLISVGAPLIDAVAGAALGGHLALVKDLLRRGARLNSAVKCAALGGHFTLVEYLILHGAPLDFAVRGAAQGGHFTLVEDLIHRGASLDDAVGGAAHGGYLANEALTYRWLASIQDPALQTEFADEVKRTNRTTFDMCLLAPSAQALSALIREKGISFDQGLAWQNPEVQGLLALARSEKYLPHTLYFLITTFLSPSLTNGKEVRDLFQKMPLEIRKVDLSIDLQNCHLSSSRFAMFRDTRPARFKLVCQNAKSEKDLDRGIEEEIRALTKKDSYSDLLQSHVPRR